MSMFNIPINRLHFIVCIKRANRKNRHNLYDTNLLVSIKNLKNTVTYNRDNQLICTTNYPVKIFAFAGMTGSVLINDAVYRNPKSQYPNPKQILTKHISNFLNLTPSPFDGLVLAHT